MAFGPGVSAKEICPSEAAVQLKKNGVDLNDLLPVCAAARDACFLQLEHLDDKLKGPKAKSCQNLRKYATSDYVESAECKEFSKMFAQYVSQLGECEQLNKQVDKIRSEVYKGVKLPPAPDAKRMAEDAAKKEKVINKYFELAGCAARWQSVLGPQGGFSTTRSNSKITRDYKVKIFNALKEKDLAVFAAEGQQALEYKDKQEEFCNKYFPISDQVI